MQPSTHWLIGCECSGALRNAFLSANIRATSVDLQPSQSAGPHIVGDVIHELYSGRYTHAFVFPPCTYLANAQVGRVRHEPKRYFKTLSAASFIRTIYASPVSAIAIENPPGLLSQYFKPSSQNLSPAYFGDRYHKPISLWLRNLPPLMYSCVNPLRKSVANHTNSRMSRDQCANIKSSWSYFPGLCAEIASQYGNLPYSQNL